MALGTRPSKTQGVPPKLHQTPKLDRVGALDNHFPKLSLALCPPFGDGGYGRANPMRPLSICVEALA